MAFIWTQGMSVGLTKIDSQHQILFKKANDLFEACNQKKGSQQIAPLLKYLDEYIVFHFNDEENYMKSINYPAYSFQKAAHDGFVKKFREIKSEYEASETNIAVLLNAVHLISEWLMKHISIEDKKIGEYAKSIGKAN